MLLRKKGAKARVLNRGVKGLILNRMAIVKLSPLASGNTDPSLLINQCKNPSELGEFLGVFLLFISPPFSLWLDC